MGVTSCTLDRALSGGVDETNRTNASVSFKFEADEKLGILGVLNGALGLAGSPLPNFGEPYDYTSDLGAGEADPTSFARRYNVQFYKGRRDAGTITVQYAPLREGENLLDVRAYSSATAPNITWNPGGNPLQGTQTLTPPSGSIPPWERGASWYFDQEAYTRIVDKDKDGNPIVNAANKSFDRPPVLEESRGVLVAEFAVETLREVVDLNRNYANKVNETAWDVMAASGFTDPPERTVLCRYVRSGKGVIEGGYAYYPVQMAFSIREDGSTWDLELLNEGYGYLKAAGGSYTDALDEDGNKVREPVLLAGDGTKLPDGDVGNFITAQARFEANFNANSLKQYLKPA